MSLYFLLETIFVFWAIETLIYFRFRGTPCPAGFFRSHDRRCSYAALHHVVAAGCARDRIPTASCHIPDGRTVFGFQSAFQPFHIGTGGLELQKTTSKNIFYRFFRRKGKAPYKTNQEGYCYPISIQFRTVLGGFSVLTDPAPLARLETVFYSVFNLPRQLSTFNKEIIQCTLPEKQELYFPLRKSQYDDQQHHTHT